MPQRGWHVVPSSHARYVEPCRADTGSLIRPSATPIERHHRHNKTGHRPRLDRAHPAGPHEGQHKSSSLVILITTTTTTQSAVRPGSSFCCFPPAVAPAVNQRRGCLLSPPDVVYIYRPGRFRSVAPLRMLPSFRAIA